MQFVIDGPPENEPGRFVEVENEQGASIRVGEWVHRADGYWALVVPGIEEMREIIEKQREAMRLTREYVGETLLPALPGWSWYDADVEAARVLGAEPVAEGSGSTAS